MIIVGVIRLLGLYFMVKNRFSRPKGLGRRLRRVIG